MEKDNLNSDKTIYNNRDQYIRLNEDDGLDITDNLFQFSKTLKLGQMISTPDFSLEDTMNSIELNHNKMDHHYRYQDSNTYKKMIREGKIKVINNLHLNEVLSLIDNLFIYEMLWLNGKSIYQTIFNLIYFTDPNIENNDDSIFRTYINSTKHLIYRIYNSIFTNCNCLREEDFSIIPISNIESYKKNKIIEELKKEETRLSNLLKDKENPDKKIITNLINRFRARRVLIKILDESFDINNKKRYDNLIGDTKTLKSLYNEMKNNLNFVSEKLDLTKHYFCDKLCRLTPIIQSLKSFELFTYEDSLSYYEKFLNNLSDISSIYELKEYYLILKSIENLNSKSPSTIIRCILDFNIFPKNSSKIFDLIDYPNVIHQMFIDFKIDFIEENSEFITNFVNINKEILLKNLRNKSRQIRESKQTFEALSVIIMESNNIEKSVKKKNQRKTVLTNLILKIYLYEMITYIFTSFELNIYSYFELDYIFYASETILSYLYNNNNLIANRFIDNIEDKTFMNAVRSSLNSSQKMILDEISIYDGLRNALKGLSLIFKYLKKKKLIRVPQTENEERLTVQNRLLQFKNHKFFIDLSYEKFIKDTYFDESEKEMILQSADLCFKQSVKILTELKKTDLTLRDSLHYPNEYIEDLCKTIISNNLLINKIKKLTSEIKIGINMQKYKTVLPLIEIK